jgi:hypothetical protein
VCRSRLSHGGSHADAINAATSLPSTLQQQPLHAPQDGQSDSAAPGRPGSPGFTLVRTLHVLLIFSLLLTLSRFQVHKTLSCHTVCNLTILFNRLLVLQLSHSRVKIQMTTNHYHLVSSHPSLMFARIPTYHPLIPMTAVTKHKKLVASNYRTVLQSLLLEMLSDYMNQCESTTLGVRGAILMVAAHDNFSCISQF